MDHRLSPEIESTRESFRNRHFTYTTEASLQKYNPHSPTLTESPSSRSPIVDRKSASSPVTSFRNSFRSVRGSPQSGTPQSVLERSPSLPFRPTGLASGGSPVVHDELKELVAAGPLFPPVAEEPLVSSPAAAAAPADAPAPADAAAQPRPTTLIGNDGSKIEPGPFEC